MGEPIVTFEFNGLVDKISPKHGDVVVITVSSPISSEQLMRFRRQLWEEATRHREKTGIWVTWLVLGAEVSITHVAAGTKEAVQLEEVGRTTGSTGPYVLDEKGEWVLKDPWEESGNIGE